MDRPRCTCHFSSKMGWMLSPECPRHTGGLIEARRQPRNGLAVAALITLLAFWPVSPVVGVLALSDIRRNGGRGTGFAWCAIIISGFMYAVLLAALTLGA